MKTRLLYSLLFLVLSVTGLRAGQAEALAGIPAPIVPIIKNIEEKYTPAQLLGMLQTASPTGWKVVQEKARLTEAGKPQSFTMEDYNKLPEKEQQALVSTLQPIIMEAMAKLSQQEQMQLLLSAKDFDADTLITPVMNLMTKKEPKK